MKYTLLEMTQRILESMDSDEVNSFSDTTESLAVANIIKECYYEIVGEMEPRETQGLFHLDASGDNTKPTLMTLPSTASRIDVLKYNIGSSVTDTNFRDIDYMEPVQFLEYMNNLDIDETWVDTQVVTIQGGSFNIKYRNDQSPYFYTSFDDRILLFDSYDSSYETTLTSSRTYCIGSVIPTFTMSDSFTPLLDARQFQLLLQSAKAQAFVELKQTVNEKAEKKEKRNRLLAQKTKDTNTDNRTWQQKHKGFGR
jgi:hypothetical protein